MGSLWNSESVFSSSRVGLGRLTVCWPGSIDGKGNKMKYKCDGCRDEVKNPQPCILEIPDDVITEPEQCTFLNGELFVNWKLIEEPTP